MTGMIVLRCAWHRDYFGWPLIKGVGRCWPLWPVLFSDGICDVCLGRVRRRAGPATLGRIVATLGRAIRLVNDR
ncbi:MAG: hypothetical protein ACREM3_15175 [Candidatus Rokuibacteriota bacterium]